MKFSNFVNPMNPLHPNISMHILHTVLFTFTKVPTRRICITIKSLGAYNVKQKSGMYNKLGNRMITHFLNWVTTNLGDSSICPDGQCPSLRSSKLTDILVPASLLYSSQPRPAVANYSDIPLRSNKIIYIQLKLKTLSPIMTDLQIKVLWSD